MSRPSFSALVAHLVDRTGIAKFLSKNVPVDCLELAAPVAADPVGLLAATATTVAVQTYLTAALVAGGKNALAAAPRNVTFTTAGGTPADAPATAVITGTDVDGNVLTETVTIAQTATIANGVKAFKTITSIVYAAGDGTAATVSIGFGNVFGFPTKAQTRAGGLGIVKEIQDGAAPGTAGTFVIPATGAPYGTYTPNAAPNAARNYAVFFERDVSGGF